MTGRARRCHYRPDRPHAQLRLPSMSPDKALLVSSALEDVIAKLCVLFPGMRSPDLHLVAAILERTLRAIWRAHGNGMADHLGMLGVDTPEPPDSVSVFASDDEPDLLF